VQAQRIKRQDKWLKRLSSKIFYLFFSYLTGVKQDGSIANFGIYHRKAIHILQQMREPMRAFPAMINWVGFKRGTLEVMHQSRFEGESTYNWHRLLNLALDFTLAYSDKPLKMTVKTGFVISAGAAFYALYVIVAYSLGLVTEPGYASLIVSIWFLSGLIIFILGILGLYLGKVFESVKNRPIYIIDKILNDDVRQ
jgi:dolichol-phosphate mannosyltransferase